MSESFDQRLRLRLLEHMATDRAGGALRPLAHYQSLFPGHEEAVASEWHDWSRPASDESTSFGAYRLERTLGRGGQGVVHEAVDTRLSRRVALKVLGVPVTDASFERSGPHPLLAREIEALTRIEDPRIANVYDAGVIEGRAYLAMRLVRGPSLRQELSRWEQRGDGPTVAERLRLGLEVVRAVASAHAQGVLHRDIKPSNVLLEDGDGGAASPVLIDFGLARALDTEVTGPHGHTVTGDQLGTPAYMAPECFRGEGYDDPRADVWALGVLLFELTAGRTPFAGKTIESLALRIERDEMPRPAVSGYGRARDLEALLQRALEKPRARRYADATALAADLEALLAGKPISARPLGPAGRSFRWVRRHPAAAAALVLFGSVAVVSTWSAVELDRARTREAAARLEATANYARAESDRAHLILESVVAGRFDAAREHLEQAVRDGGIPGARIRSDFVRALGGTDIVARERYALGGLGIVKLDPSASLVAARCVSPDSRRPELSFRRVAGDGPAPVPASSAPLPPIFTLLAVHPNAFAIAERDRLSVWPLGESSPIEARSIPARTEPGPRPGSVPHGSAQFDAAGRLLVCTEGRTWTLHDLGTGAELASATAAADLGGLANFSPSGRWLAVRQDQRTIRIYDQGRAPIQLSMDYPVAQAVPLDGERAGVVLLQAKPAGLELGVWTAPEPRVDGRRPRPRYVPLTRVRGAAFPGPRIAVHGRFVAAATTTELVVVDIQDRRVRAHCKREGGALEALAFRGDAGVALTGLDLFVQQRSAPLQRFGFEQISEFVERFEPDAARTPPDEAARLVVDVQKPIPSPDGGAPSLPRATVRFRGGSDLSVSSDEGGTMFVPPGARTPTTRVDTPDGAIGAALVGVVRRDAIVVVAHVWREGTVEPIYRFEVASVPGLGGIALSRDGESLAVLTAENRLQIHAVADRALLLDVPLDIVAVGQRVRALEFDERGCLWIATASERWRWNLPAIEKALAARGLGRQQTAHAASGTTTAPAEPDSVRNG